MKKINFLPSTPWENATNCLEFEIGLSKMSGLMRYSFGQAFKWHRMFSTFQLCLLPTVQQDNTFSIIIPIPNTLANGIPNITNYLNFLKHVTFLNGNFVSGKVGYVITAGLMFKDPYSRFLDKIFYTHKLTRFCGMMHD